MSDLKKVKETLKWYDENKDSPQDGMGVTRIMMGTLNVLVPYIRELEEKIKK